GKIFALLTCDVAVGNVKVEESIFHPRDDVAFVVEIIENLGGISFPATINDNSVHMAVPRGIRLATCLAVNETGTTGGVVVAQDWADGFFAWLAGLDATCDMSDKWPRAPEVQELFPFRTSAKHANLRVIPIFHDR